MSDDFPHHQSRAIRNLGNLPINTLLKIRARFRKHHWFEISFDIAIILTLISIGLLARLLLAHYFRINFFVDGQIENPWNRDVLFNPNGVPFYGFTDFSGYYVPWTTAWYEQNWYPYQWPEPFTTIPLNLYSYPPLFLYFLVALWRPGMSNLWIAFPLILADAICAGVVYLILKNIIKGENSRAVSLFGGLLMVFAPINLVYVGVYWLNTGPVTLFTLLSFYFVIKDKWWQAFFWLALATMTKQNGLFFSYPLFMVMLAQKTREKGIKKGAIESVMNAALFLIICFLVSIPWVFISPTYYGAHLLFPGKPLELTTAIIEPPTNQCIQFSWSLLAIGLQGWLLAIVAFGINSMLLMITSATVIAVSLSWRSYNKNLDKIEFFEWIAVYTIFTHIFMPRGVYKFYTAYYVPMILIAILGSFSYLSQKKWSSAIGLVLSSVLFFGFNVWLLAMNRWFLPFFLFMLCILIGALASIRVHFRRKVEQSSPEKGRVCLKQQEP